MSFVGNDKYLLNYLNVVITLKSFLNKGMCVQVV